MRKFFNLSIFFALILSLIFFSSCDLANNTQNTSSEADISVTPSQGENSIDASNTDTDTSGEDESLPDVSDLPDLEAEYRNALRLYEQDPDSNRDPGELQSETQSMIRLEDGLWYQSFVYSDFNCRCVFLSNDEFAMDASWDFVPIGSAENSFLFNAGNRYSDDSGVAPYAEHYIAVCGTVSAGDGGYAYMLYLPDKLTVCVEGEDGVCLFLETDVLAVPEDSFKFDIGGETVLKGVVTRDQNGVLYLNNVSLFSE